MIEAIQICDFEPRYQDAAAGLINEGLGDRFGIADPSMNPDLYDIAESYESGEFLLALDDARLVGTGALMPQDPNTGQIARMHTARGYRRLGVGTEILGELERRARVRQLTRIILETNMEWEDAINFYLRNGYIESSRGKFVVRFQKAL